MFVFDLRGLDRDRPRGSSAYLLSLAERMLEAAPGRVTAWSGGDAPPGTVVRTIDLEPFLSSHLRDLPERLRAGLEARAAGIVAVPSELAADAAVRYARLPAERLAVCPPPPPRFQRTSRDEAEAARATLGLPGRYLLYFGSLRPRRRLEVLLQAWAAARTRLPAATGLVVAGEGGLPRGPRPGVTVTGYVPAEHVPGLLSGALAWLNPSPFEHSTQGLLEAMACGAPPVVAKETLLAATVRDAGVAVEASDVAMWAEAMVVLATSSGERGRLSTAARAAAASLAGSWNGSTVTAALEAAD